VQSRRTYIPAKLFVKSPAEKGEDHSASANHTRNDDSVDVNEVVDSRSIGIRSIERLGELSREN